MRKKTLSIVAALFMCACGAWAQTAGAGSITVLPTDVMSKQSYMLVSPRGTLYFDANVKATSLTSNCSGPESPTKDVTVTAEEEKGQFLLFPAENYEHGYYVYSVAASKFIKQDDVRAALVDEPNVVYIWAHGATGTGTQAYSNASFEKSDYGFTIGSAYSSALPFNSINVCCWDASNRDYRWCNTGSLDDGNMYAIVEAEEVGQDVWKAAYDKIYNVGYTVNIVGTENGGIEVDENTYGANASFSHSVLTLDDIKVTPVEGYLATVSISDEHIITVTYTEKTFKPTDAYTLFAQKSQRGYLASWTGESNYVSLAGVTLVDGGTDYSTRHPALNADGVAINWELDEVAAGKVTFKNINNGLYLVKDGSKAKWSETPMEFTFAKESDGSYHFQASNNQYLVAACGYQENEGAAIFGSHEDASDFVVTMVDRDTENPDIDAALEAAKEEYTAASAAIGEFMTAYGANANEDIQAVLEAFNEALSAIHLSENPTVDEYKAATATINDAISKAQTEVDEILGNVDPDLLAAQKALDDYMQNVVLPLMDEIQELDENSDEYKALEAEIVALSEAFGDYLSTPNPTDVESCTALLESFKVLVKDYEEVKSQLEPDAETDLDKAKAAYDAAVAEYMALIEQYGSLANTSTEAHEIIENLNTSIKWVVDKDATAEEYNTVANSIKTGVEAAAEALEEIAGSTPAAPVFPAAGDYYVYIKNYDTARNPYLYNNVDEATGYTLQAADLDNANNGYIWHVTSDGNGKITSIVSGTGKGVGVNGGSKPVLSELDYEDAGEGYYYIGNSTIDAGWKWLNASNGGQTNGKGTRTVTNYSKENASKWTFETVNMEGLTAYNVVVEGCAEGLAVLNGEYAGNNGFFLTASAEGVEAKTVENYNTSVSTVGNTITVTYTPGETLIAARQDAIVAALAKVGQLGYPKADADAVTALNNYTVTADNYAASTTLLANLYACTDVVMPEVGKSYRVAFRKSNGSLQYINGDATSATADDATVLTLAASDGNEFAYTLAGADGSYLTNKGVKSDATTVRAASINLKFGQLSASQYVTLDASKYYGAFALYTEKRYDRDDLGCLVMGESANGFDGANAPFFNGSYTSAIVLEEVESTPEVDEFAEALDFFYESAEATLQYLRTNYGAAVVGLKAEDAIEELNVLIVGLRTFNKPTTMEEIEEAFDAVSDAALKFYDSCTITVLSRVISEAKEGEETEPTTLEKVKEIEDAILAKYGISALSNKK